MHRRPLSNRPFGSILSRRIAIAAILGSFFAAAALIPACALAADAAPASPTPKKLGILVFPGVQVIDFTGPYEVLSGAGTGKHHLFDVKTVGVTDEVFRTGGPTEGFRMIADYTIDNCPKLDILVIPGGEVGELDSPKVMQWINKAVGEAECVMSVCNGAFVLAKGGHLKNQPATTFYWFIERLREDEPTCTPVYDQRFVDTGKIITTAGLSSGIDGALHLIERYGGRYDAEQRALGLEYNWQPELNWSRANLADRHYIKMVGRGFNFPEGAITGWRTVKNNGTMDEWTRAWTFTSTLTGPELLKLFEPKLSAAWTRSAASADKSTWTFKDDKSRPWTATLTLAPAPAEANWSATMRLERDK